MSHSQIDSPKLVVAMTTTATDDDARKLAATLVEAKLAACVQIVGPITSSYHWQGKVETSTEYRCEIKTVNTRLGEIDRLFQNLHPYDVPELIVLPVEYSSAEYAAWLIESVS